MTYVEVVNLEKYHPGYSDRNLIWCKVYFTILNADPEFELLCEIDKWRFIAFIILQLQTKKPIPLDKAYLERKGFDYKTRDMSLTLKMLHNFIRVCGEDKHQPYRRVEKSRVEKSRVDVTPQDFITSLKTNPAYRGIDLETEFGKMDAWLLAHPHRKKTDRFIVNWLNRADRVIETKKPEVKVERPEPINQEERAKVAALIHQTAQRMKEIK